MTVRENLLSRFLKDDRKADELECFLSTLGDASQKEKGKVKFAELEVEYDVTGRKMKAIRATVPGDSSVLASLEKNVEEALYTDHGIEVEAAYFFTDRPITGALRLGNVLQILPVPHDAPKIVPPSLIGDHPAILQFTYQKSKHRHVNIHRMERKKRELLLLLSVLTKNEISWPDNTLQYRWARDILSEDLADSRPKYCQVGYGAREEWDQRDDSGFFVNSGWLEIPRKDYQQYYGSLALAVSEPFQLPNTFEESVAKFLQLSEGEFVLFLRSAHWFVTCSNVFHRSHSLAYVSLVYALEVLAPASKKTGSCELCRRDVFDKSISERFRELLEEYGAGLPKKDVDKIYSLRSSIAHGGGLMPQDREVLGFRFAAEQNEKSHLFRRLQHVCMVVLINWLHSGKRSTTA